MINILQNLSNVEVLSGFITPYKNRVNKLSVMARIFQICVSAKLDQGDESGIIVPDDSVEFYNQAIEYLYTLDGQSVMVTDPDSEYVTVLWIDAAVDSVHVHSCVSDGQGGFLPREYPFLTISKTEQDTTYVYWQDDRLKDCRNSSEAEILSILDTANKLEDQLTSYNVTLDAISLTIKNKDINASDYAARVHSMYAGLKNGSLDLFQNMTNALATHDVSSVVAVIKNFLNPQGTTVDSDGEVHFPTTVATKELSFGAVIASALPALITTLGTVVTALYKPIGLALYGLGTIASAATRGIASAVNSSTNAIFNSQSENPDIAIKLRQDIYDRSAPSLIARNIIAEAIQPTGFTPHKYELPGISGYVWPYDYDGTDASSLNAKMVHECYLSCRGYATNRSLKELCNSFLTITRKSYSYSDGYGEAVVNLKVSSNAPSLWSFISRAYAVLTPVDFDSIEFGDPSEKNEIYQKCVLTDAVIITMLYAIMSKIDGSDNGIDVTVPIAVHHPYPDSNIYDITCVGVQFLCDPYHDTFRSMPMVSWDSDHSWDTNPDYTTGYESYNEVQMSKISIAIDSHGISDYLNRLVLMAMLTISQYMMNLQDPVTQDEYDGTFQFYPVEQRFDFRIRPPLWTRRSIVFNAVLTGVIIAGIATIGAVVTTKVNKWRKTKQLEMQTKTEAAWDKCKQNPSAENLAAYRSAAFRQNTIGKIYGCSGVSNSNYWSTPGLPSTTSSDIVNDVQSLIPTVENNTDGIIHLIKG